MRTKTASGTAVLQVANQLSQIAAVEYATLDFIHAASTQLAKASGVKATAKTQPN